MADETTDVSDRAELATFVRYIDSDSTDVKEEFLGLVQIKGNKGAAQICEKISELFRDKAIGLSNMGFSFLDGTNSMSVEITGLQQRLRHLSPHMKYINCQNHQLALKFVHLLTEFKSLQDVDQLLLNLWKIFKYSSFKFSVFEKAQESEGLTPLKLLNCATARWLSHGAATQRIISRFR